MPRITIECESLLIANALHRTLADATLLSLDVPADLEVVLLVAFQEANGRRALLRLMRRRPRARVLVLSLGLGESFEKACQRAGAWSVLPERTSRLELIEAVRRTADGRISRREAETDGVAHPERFILTDRELAVMRGIQEGKSLKEIAHELQISLKTVSTYRRRTLDKLGMRTNADLILYTPDGP